MRPADVTVVIPVLNGGPRLAECLRGILDQQLAPVEIVVIDSGSTDGSLGIARSFDRVRVIEIPAAEFNHGGTRNLGVLNAATPLVVFTVQDAVPASRSWLSELVEPLSDERVAAVTGAQIVPHDRDKNPVDWYRPQSEGTPVQYAFPEPGQFDALHPREKRWACAVDNVATAYRRDVLLALPFPHTPFGEDVLWGCAALRAGWTLVFNPRARVFHYHNETPDFAYHRAFASMYYRHAATGFLPGKPRLLPELLRSMSILVREPGLSWSEKIRWTQYNWMRNAAALRARDHLERWLIEDPARTAAVVTAAASMTPPATVSPGLRRE